MGMSLPFFREHRKRQFPTRQCIAPSPPPSHLLAESPSATRQSLPRARSGFLPPDQAKKRPCGTRFLHLAEPRWRECCKAAPPPGSFLISPCKPDFSGLSDLKRKPF